MFMRVVNQRSVNKLDLTWKQSFLILPFFSLHGKEIDPSDSEDNSKRSGIHFPILLQISFIHSLIYLFIHLHILSFIHAFNHTFTHSFLCILLIHDS